MEIKQLHGTEEQLYRLVAPLVMNPAILKQNHNYPFRTSDQFEWFIASNDEGQIVGFIPVEHKRLHYVINNYYIMNRDATILALLIQRAIDTFSPHPLIAIAFREDKETFQSMGFEIEKQWTFYIKMKKEATHAER